MGHQAGLDGASPFGPDGELDDWSDEDFRDFERQLHAETHAVYLARVMECAPVEADELETPPW
jgi:hypothetical protein